MKTTFLRPLRAIAFIALLSFISLAPIKVRISVRAQASSGQLNESVYKGLQFRSIGPTIMGGRIDDFAVVESNPHVIYAATASGGLWKTVNNGVTWEPAFDNESVSSIGDVAVAPSNSDIVWAGTGEANNRQSSSWGNGVYKSTDGGKTWTNTKFINEDTGFIDVAMDTEDPNTLYAAAYQRRRTPFGYNGGGPHSGLYKTTDGGATWAKLAGGLPEGDAGRIGIDVYCSSPEPSSVCSSASIAARPPAEPVGCR